MTESTKLVEELQVLVSEGVCCGDIQRGGYCCGSPVPTILTDEAKARDFGVAVFNAWPQLRGMAADAERYRWLREQSDITIEGKSSDWSGGYYPQQFDEFIDAALAAGGSRE